MGSSKYAKHIRRIGSYTWVPPMPGTNPNAISNATDGEVRGEGLAWAVADSMLRGGAPATMLNRHDIHVACRAALLASGIDPVNGERILDAGDGLTISEPLAHQIHVTALQQQITDQKGQIAALQEQVSELKAELDKALNMAKGAMSMAQKKVAQAVDA